MALMLSFSPLFLQSAAAEECAPIALLEGDPQVLPKIEEILIRQGIAVTPTGECPFVRVRVERRDQGLFVRITDSFGRVSRKVVDDEESVAALVESWARSEIGLRWVEPRVKESPETTAADKQPETEQEPERKQETLSDESNFDLFAATETSWGTEESFWIGASSGGRAKLGSVMLGGRLRFASMLNSPKSDDNYNLTRYAADCLATLDIPLLPKSFRLMPGIGFGIGWLRTEGDALDEDTPGTSVERETFDTWGPIGQAGIMGGWKFQGGLGLAMEAGFRFYAPSQTRDFVRDERHLSGEPWGFYSLALHLMYSE